jgi:hypothetical protein
MTEERALRVAPAIDFKSERAAPVVRYTGVRTTPLTVGATSSVATEIPPGARVLELRLTDSVYIRFGHSDLAAAAADSNNDLVVGGEKIVIVPEGTTHFRAIRVGSNDVSLQIAEVDLDGGR